MLTVGLRRGAICQSNSQITARFNALRRLTYPSVWTGPGASRRSIARKAHGWKGGLLSYTPMAYSARAGVMLTIVESPLFARLWPDYWTEDERGEFCAFIACNADAGELIPGSGGCRKVRWIRAGTGKRSGVRVIYTARRAAAELVLLVIYAKSARDTIPAHVLRKIAKEMSNAAT
jgi:hypothetical protein